MRYLNSVLLVAAIALLADQAWADRIIGRFAVAKGKVELIDASGKKTRARFGTKVSQGDTVVTDAESRAKIVLLDKNEVNISPESKIVFESYDISDSPKKTNVIGVLYGKVRNNLKQKYDGKDQKFQVRTQAAVAGVRGTDFLAEYILKKKQAKFTTFKGLIEVGILGKNGNFFGSVLVYPGQQTDSSGGQTGTPKNLSKDQLNKLDKETDSESEEKSDEKTSKKEKAKKEQKEVADKDSKKKSWGKSVLKDIVGDDLLTESETELDKYSELDLLNQLEKGGQNPAYVKAQIDDCQFCKDTVTNATSNLLINVNLGE